MINENDEVEQKMTLTELAIGSSSKDSTCTAADFLDQKLRILRIPLRKVLTVRSAKERVLLER